jgi:hypothetical protein
LTKYKRGIATIPIQRGSRSEFRRAVRIDDGRVKAQFAGVIDKAQTTKRDSQSALTGGGHFCGSRLRDQVVKSLFLAAIVNGVSRELSIGLRPALVRPNFPEQDFLRVWASTSVVRAVFANWAVRCR